MPTSDGKNSRNGSWRKYFKVANTNQLGQMSPISGKNNFGLPGYNRANADFDSGLANEFAFRNYASRLPEVYSGHPNRLERYNQYENMDCDSEVNACLDIIAEFSTQTNEDNGTPFNINFVGKPTDHEVEIIKKQLQQWSKLNKLDQRIFKLFRNTIKYGDQVFVRDPETYEMYWVDMIKVARIIVNESEGKRPEQYIVRDINPNFQNMSMAAKTTSDYYVSRSTGSVTTGNNYNSPNGGGGGGGSGNSRFTQAMNETCLDAKHVVHLSLNEGLDYFWPFGQSILENIFKVYKQKELLEDSVLIYRVQRAPERRLFKIDVGNMPSHMAMAFVERVKNEMHQRRIPTYAGGGASMMDASYNPLSVNEDYFFPQTCLSLDTHIKLLDGRDVSLDNLIKEYKEGKENFVYTVNQFTLEIEPGKIVWADITRRNTQVVEVTLDNGEKVICTPDHRFIMRDGSEVEAQHLQSDNSIMPLYLSNAKTSKHQGASKYLKYVCPKTGKSKWVHTMVCPKEKPGKETEIHHIDLNSLNNNPTNLVEMETQAHRKLHSDLGTYHLTNAWNDPEKRATLVSGIRTYHANATSEDKEMMRVRGLKNGAKTWERPESAKSSLEALAENRTKAAKAKKITYSVEMAERMIELYNEGYTSISKLCLILRIDDKFQTAFKIANPNITRDKNKSATICPGDNTLKLLSKKLGYSSWEEFKEKYAYNHKVVSVVWLDKFIDTGDITIESVNNNHNFALSCGIFVHNSEGRGSSVEVLPGGQNLGEIDDLKYFNNKMARGLRVPSSYLPTGPDDSSQPMSDGRVGTALIQEFRFNKYCERLQKLIMQKLDDEFKMFMKWRGFNLDDGLFNLQLCEPQNFASYRQSELDTARISNFSSVEPLPYMSKRFLLKRYLGLTEEEIVENETLWREERDVSDQLQAQGQDLRNVGVTPAGMDADLSTGDELAGSELGAAEPDAGGGAEPAAAPEGPAGAAPGGL